jgi:hypothetical protein
MEERDKGRLISNLESLPHELDDLVGEMTDDDLRWRPIPGKWSIGEILVHLRDVEREVFQPRLSQTIFDHEPQFQLWDQDRAASERDYGGQSGREALAAFKEARRATVRLLGETPLESWQRAGVHPERGHQTLEEQVTRQIRTHDLSHLVQIKDILRIKMPW